MRVPYPNCTGAGLNCSPFCGAPIYRPGHMYLRRGKGTINAKEIRLFDLISTLSLYSYFTAMHCQLCQLTNFTDFTAVSYITLYSPYIL
jgi:hypothetical protein